MSDERIAVIQAVVDRQTSYQESATADTVESELRQALDETDADVTAEELSKLVHAIERSDAPVDVGDVLS